MRVATLLCLGLVASQTAAAGPVAGRPGSDWPSFLGPTGNSVSTEKGIITPWPRDGLRLVWHMKTGEGYAVPAISDGKLFLFDRHGENMRLSALERDTGKLIWKFEYATNYEDKYNYSNGPRCAPVVDGDRVYIYGSEGMLHCLKSADGKLVWKLDTAKKYEIVQNFFGVGSAPVIEGDLLIAQVGGSPKESQEADFDKVKGNGSAVVAFDKKTGEEKWKTSNELASYGSPTLATIGSRRWCFVFARGGLLALDPAKGKEDFHHPYRAKSFESVNASTPVVVGDKVFVSETYGVGGALFQVKPGEHKIVWSDADKGRDKSMMCHWNTPIYHDGYLYGCSGRHDTNAELRCIEFETGKVMWSQPRLARTSLLMVDGHFICIGEYGEVRLLKINPKQFEQVSAMLVFPPGADGKPDRTADPLLQYPCWGAPILAHGLLYIRCQHELVCLELIPPKK